MGCCIIVVTGAVDRGHRWAGGGGASDAYPVSTVCRVRVIVMENTGGASIRSEEGAKRQLKQVCRSLQFLFLSLLLDATLYVFPLWRLKNEDATPAFSVRRSLAGTYEAMLVYRRTLPQLNRAALTLSACTPLLQWHFLFPFISRGALVPAWKLQMKTQSNSTNDCRSADWAAFKKREQKLWAFHFTSFPSRRCGCLCWMWFCRARRDVTSDFILGIWDVSANIYEHEHIHFREDGGRQPQTYSPSVKVCFIALHSTYT